jgi:Na+/H+ antiporter NhaC
MAIAILDSLKQGAYTAIALYVVFIAVITIVSLTPQLNTPSLASTQTSVVALDRATDQTKARAS